MYTRGIGGTLTGVMWFTCDRDKSAPEFAFVMKFVWICVVNEIRN